MDYAVLQPALVAWVKALTGLAVVVWQDEPRPQSNGALGTLSWLGSGGVGVDEVLYEDTGAAKPAFDLVPVVRGLRTLRLQVSVDTFSQLPAGNARTLLEALRDRLRAPSSLATLRAVNLGVIGATDITEAPYKADQRWIKRALIELRFNATSGFRDTAGALPSIETVEVTTTITRPDGTTAAERTDTFTVT